MTEDATQEAQGAAETAPKAPAKPRPKMTLDEQAIYVGGLLERCRMHGPDFRGQLAGEATLTLTRDDMDRLSTIEQTLRVFDLWRADRLVKDAIDRKRRETFRK